MNIFSGITILDLTRVFSGPFATLHFAQYGANVIKVEPPQGDDSRSFPPLKDNWSGYFEILNHNKKSIFLDLKNDSDLNKFYELCKHTDIVVENFTPKVKENLKIDYPTIKKINKNIIYASISGISENVDRKYYDVIAQAESGIISLNGNADDMKISTSIVDAFSGMKLAHAISSALYYRQKTGKGQKINVSIKGSAFDLLEQNLIQSSVTNNNPSKVGNMDNAIAPFGLFKTKDGAIVLAVGNDTIWSKFSEFLLSENSGFNTKIFENNSMRLKNIEELKCEIEHVFKKYLTKDLINILSKLDIPCGSVNKMLDVLNDQENYEEELLLKFKHPKVGEIVTSTGGIKYSLFDQEDYVEAPTK